MGPCAGPGHDPGGRLTAARDGARQADRALARGRRAGACGASMKSVMVAVATLALVGCGHLVVLNDPLTAAEHNDLGVAYERAGQRELAAREYHKALRRDRGFAVARVNLGNLAAASGRWSEAERCYRRALRARPDD